MQQSSRMSASHTPLSFSYELARKIYLSPVISRVFRFAVRYLWLSRALARRSLWLVMGRVRKHWITENPVLLSNMEIRVINLNDRGDRWQETLREFHRMGVANLHRFEAISDTPGILGCTRSHAAVLASIPPGAELSLICEDDVEFLGSRNEIEDVIAEFARDDSLDVLALAYNLGSAPHKISSLLAVTHDSQTAACYLVKKRAIKPLIEIFALGVDLLEKGYPPSIAANDVIWKKAQKWKLTFAIPLKRLVRQRESFSDIEGRIVNYGL